MFLNIWTVLWTWDLAADDWDSNLLPGTSLDSAWPHCTSGSQLDLSTSGLTFGDFRGCAPCIRLPSSSYQGGAPCICLQAASTSFQDSWLLDHNSSKSEKNEISDKKTFWCCNYPSSCSTIAPNETQKNSEYHAVEINKY